MAGPADEGDGPPAKRPRSGDADGWARRRRPSGRRFPDVEGEGEEFHFVQLADTQLGLADQFVPRDQRQGWAQELAHARRAAAEINRLRPAFAIVCGDLVDEFPSEERDSKADPDMRAAQVRDFQAAMGLVDPDIPLLCICGNHDIGNRPNAITVRKFSEQFGDDYFSFRCHGVRCIVVNSQFWKDDSDAEDLRKAMDAWLDAELDGPPAPTLVFSHIPPFVNDAGEKSEYFNIGLELRKRWLRRFAARGATGWFSGHYHRNAGGTFTDEDGRKLEVVVTAAVGAQLLDKPGGEPLGLSGIGGAGIGEDVSGLRVVRVSPGGRFSHRWRTFADLRAEVEEAALA